MADISYRPLIEDMTWSYSRVTTYQDCPYRFFLKYIINLGEKDMFYASYGSFMHKLIERYYRGELDRDGMLREFLANFSTEVKGERPKGSTVEKYIMAGVRYLKGFVEFPFNMVAVEQLLEFDIDGIPVVGYADFIGELYGEYYIVDNKSRELEPRSGRAKPTAKDKELDKMLRQLYIYSAGIKQKYGKFPKELCFNCFKNDKFIREPFNEEAYAEAIEWFKREIEYAKAEEEFEPYIDFFSCKYICGVNDECCYNEVSSGRKKAVY